jgi:hypothetical protein
LKLSTICFLDYCDIAFGFVGMLLLDLRGCCYWDKKHLDKAAALSHNSTRQCSADFRGDFHGFGGQRGVEGGRGKTASGRIGRKRAAGAKHSAGAGGWAGTQYGAKAGGRSGAKADSACAGEGGGKA